MVAFDMTDITVTVEEQVVLEVEIPAQLPLFVGSISANGPQGQRGPIGPVTKTYILPGPVYVASGELNYIPPVFVTVPPSQTLSLVRARYLLHSGTHVEFSLQKNGVNIPGFTNLDATTSVTSTTGSYSVADGDLIAPVVTAVSGSPQHLTIELEFV